jgi:hypothetical protein
LNSLWGKKSALVLFYVFNFVRWTLVW